MPCPCWVALCQTVTLAKQKRSSWVASCSFWVIARWFEGVPATQGVAGEVVRDDQAITVFCFALALIVVGVGLLKPNISTVVGRLYGENDPRRDGGFTIFYMGINIGAASASLLCGWLASAYGWAYGFGAGIGMLIGLIVFSVNRLVRRSRRPSGSCRFKAIC